MAVTVFKLKKRLEYQQKTVLAHEIHKVLGILMVDLSQARENTIQDVPADGQWHRRFAFVQAQQGAMEYSVREGHLFRTSNGKEALIADDIADLRIRRQKETPGILEVQIEAQKNVSLISNLKIRLRQ